MRPRQITLALCLLLLGARAPRTADVAISGFTFAPAALTVAVGDTVVWTNTDDRDHAVRAADGSFDSGNLSPGHTFRHTFTRAGAFPYACPLHPRTKAVITVTPALPAPPPGG